MCLVSDVLLRRALLGVCFDSIRWLRFGPLLDTLVWLSPLVLVRWSWFLVVIVSVCGRALFFTFRPALLTVVFPLSYSV